MWCFKTNTRKDEKDLPFLEDFPIRVYYTQCIEISFIFLSGSHRGHVTILGPAWCFCPRGNRAHTLFNLSLRYSHETFPNLFPAVCKIVIKMYFKMLYVLGTLFSTSMSFIFQENLSVLGSGVWGEFSQEANTDRAPTWIRKKDKHALSRWGRVWKLRWTSVCFWNMELWESLSLIF